MQDVTFDDLESAAPAGAASAPGIDPALRPLLDEIEGYYDAVPRSAARVEDFGPLSLFVREGQGWPYYARPALGHTGPAATAEDVRRVLERQRELGVPEAFEWVAEHDPGLRAAVEEAGLTVHEHPLLVLGPDDEPEPPATAPGAGSSSEGVAVRIMTADDPDLASAVTVPHLAFGEPGTARGTVGPEELAAAAEKSAADGTVERIAGRITAGQTVLAAAVRDGVALCAGQHNPVGAVTEVAGVGTLPTARRQGLGLAVTAALVAHARANGVRTVFLSAADEDVARIYRRAGFRPFATALIAEAAAEPAPGA
ncbi:GNAT family N-acetyltransferase [Kitasatospora sp. A2-31]|uniref:GNAT family N-acetyltransferase n=1 Tax=Kitasatospora sp. A2-31 TaxID=2916414 RepID=UPI001EE9255B|nr:GNAT family N-acetyltransferase [Kitasatospora sp. A2-31]MCG6493646.1 GNAT family N-acetyltransferase [Kitasatospora sp. A2-31]